MPSYLLPTEPVESLEAYLATETGGRGLERAVELGPAATIAAIDRSGLRGRGGAGFPTGRKWRSIAEGGTGTTYVVANGAEGEPGTFKDRALLRANPYQLVEGVIIAGFAVGAREAFIAMKASFTEQIERVTAAVADMQAAGMCAQCTVTVVHGPDEYLFGEEKALLEVVEGKPPLPRLLPPYEHGLFATDVVTGWEPTPGQRSPNPTLVNNVETLSSVPHILARGADWYRSMGTAESPGNLVCTVAGDVLAPDVGEIELGTSLGDVIDAVGSGLRPDRSVKAVISGVANPVVTDLSIPVSYEGFAAAGSGLGAGGFVVFDDTACMVEAARVMSRFLYVESCGQCPPCKLGTGAITDILERLEGGEGDARDIDELASWLAKVTDGNRCYLPVQERLVVGSILERFADEVSEHWSLGRCPRPRHVDLAKLVDLRDGTATLDARWWRKQPDWTYAED
jgi:NADH:ubiquinone oxidoreductase subunit F (NADH-binding)